MANRNLYIKEVKSNFVSPIGTDTTLTIPSIAQTIFPRDSTSGPGFYETYTFDDIPNSKITVTDPQDSVTTVASGVANSGAYTFTKSGVYAIRYIGAITHSTFTSGSPTLNSTSPFTVAFYITVVPNFAPKPRWNIRTVLERILRNHQTRRLSEVYPEPPYILDPAQAAEFEKTEAPEFYITNKTLKEALDIVGGFIHGVPRLRPDANGKLRVIHFDMLGGTDKAALSDPQYLPITNIYTQSIEDYATELVSPTDNLVNSIDPAEGTITEPFAGGYVSTRSEDIYARITEENMVIPTSLPVYSVQKVYYLDDSAGKLDITPYIFEAAEYGRLSSFEGTYPLSKAFAAYYTVGERNIKGLSFKAPKVCGGAESNYAITNIIKAAGGEDISATLWEDGKYAELKFQVIYTPVFSTRIRMHKTEHTVGAPQSALYYNQSGNLIESSYYGEHLRGVIARMGNVENTRTYRTQNSSLIPKAGQLWGEYYVAGVYCELTAADVKFTVGLSKDFNRLSQYVGINSEWRAYEVSEKTAYKREITYCDYAIIGDGITGDGDAAVGSAGVLRDCFFGSTASEPLTAALVTTYDDNGGIIATVTLPIVSTAFGNVLSFQFSMADNYSAGLKAVYNDQDKAQGFWQTDAPYSDYYGEAKTCTFELYKQGDMSADANAPFDVPQGDLVSGSDMAPIRITSNDPLDIHKNGGEALSFNYEMQFVTTEKAIIGSGLARRSKLIGAANTAIAGLYVLNRAIGKFDKFIDLSPEVSAKVDWSPNALTVSGDTLVFGDVQAPVSGQSWAIADSVTGELLFGKNVRVTRGSAIILPNITVTHNLP